MRGPAFTEGADMKDLEYPRLMYRPGTAWQLESGAFDLLTVKSAAEAEAAHAEGWRLDQYAAGEVGAEEDEEQPLTRAELEAKAAELGIKYHHKTGDKRLAELIAAAS